MEKHIRKNIELGILFGLIFAIALSFARFDAKCDGLRQNVLRLHIIANSDSVEDQNLKLAVRDEILRQTEDVFLGCSSLAEAEKNLGANISKFTDIALEVIRENGFTYGAEASIGDSFFETREYEDFTLPAGNYRSLIVNLGEGRGKNWWCVVFPCVCLPSSAAELQQSVPEQSVKVAENPQKYVMKFKTAEIYEEIKQYFKVKSKK